MLTLQDIDVLFQALDAYEKQENVSDIMSLMFAGAIAKDKSQFRDMVDEVERDRAKRAMADNVKKEQVILLKAKLLQIRDKAIAEEISEGFND